MKYFHKINLRHSREITLRQLGNMAKTPIRLKDIGGCNGKNDVIFIHSATATKNVIYFGGDIQNYPEEMPKRGEIKSYREWNLENTATLLHKHFEDSNIFIVKPSRMHLRTFSVFENFVPSNDFGSPDHIADYGGLKHLICLIMNCFKELKERITTGKSSAIGNGSEENKNKSCLKEKELLPLVLTGFSKGCVVLNQFLYELELAKLNPSFSDFVKQIESMYWLDGGHSGGSNTWINDDKVLRSLKDTEIKIHVHVTPYQVKDMNRPWIGQEKKKFVSKLKRLGITVTDTLHFDDEEVSLDNHFRVLESF
ncbi:unnamed protein product [Owenia fusiformis]|uniref:Uncharacterized protein n=1 Tax=Owenia fusiformis TaxID=6347 RepID=A0A8J1UX81_OWEFU|nr:unnamed protein product [Owenia fusiformis]